MYRVGNGRNIYIWRNLWDEDERGIFIESDEVEKLKIVGDLIILTMCRWNGTVLLLNNILMRGIRSVSLLFLLVFVEVVTISCGHT